MYKSTCTRNTGLRKQLSEYMLYNSKSACRRLTACQVFKYNFEWPEWLSFKIKAE